MKLFSKRTIFSSICDPNEGRAGVSSITPAIVANLAKVNNACGLKRKFKTTRCIDEI